jgi:hypothetical protein
MNQTLRDQSPAFPATSGDCTVTTPSASRESYLAVAVDNLEPLFKAAGLTVPPLLVTVAHPLRARSELAQCLRITGERRCQVSVSPRLRSTHEVLAWLVHSMAHAVAGPEQQHGSEFIRVVERIGLTRPWKHPVPTGPLQRQLTKIADRLGPYPFIVVAEPTPQRGRFRLWQCPRCGLKVRIARDRVNLTCNCTPGGTLLVMQRPSR